MTGDRSACAFARAIDTGQRMAGLVTTRPTGTGPAGSGQFVSGPVSTGPVSTGPVFTGRGPAALPDDPSFTLRRVMPQDAPALHKIFVDAVTTGAAGRYSPAERAVWLPDPAMPGGWADRLARNITLVAETASGPAGFMMMEPDGYLNLAFVRPESMGRGVAGPLHDGIMAEARRLGLVQVFALASRYLRGFLLRRGWHEVPEFARRPDLRQRFGPDGRPMNVPMQRDLGPE